MAEPEPVTASPSTCPYCLEAIRPGAKKCKHCGEFLSDAVMTLRRPTDVRTAATLVLMAALVAMGLVLQFVVTIDGAHLVPVIPIAFGYGPAAVALVALLSRRTP